MLVSALRDEGPHLLEWIAHHRAAGVTDFLLFSNDCTDGTSEMLDALSDFGVVHLDNQPPKGKSLQWNALKLAWKHGLRRACDWVLFIDCDEFVNLRPPLNSLTDLIDACPEADAILLPWRLFGHNGQVWANDRFTTDAFTRAAPAGCDYPIGSRQFKTLFKAKGPFRQMGVHRPRAKRDVNPVWVDGSGRTMPQAFAEAEQRIVLYRFPEASKLVQLNHYSLRSCESFMVKRARGLPNRSDKEIDLMYWVERNFNSVEDTSIQRMSSGTKRVINQILQVPGMAELQAHARRRHKAIFQSLIRRKDQVKLFGRIQMAEASAPLSPPAVQRLVQMFGQADE